MKTDILMFHVTTKKLWVQTKNFFWDCLLVYRHHSANAVFCSAVFHSVDCWGCPKKFAFGIEITRDSYLNPIEWDIFLNYDHKNIQKIFKKYSWFIPLYAELNWPTVKKCSPFQLIPLWYTQFEKRLIYHSWHFKNPSHKNKSCKKHVSINLSCHSAFIPFFIILTEKRSWNCSLVGWAVKLAGCLSKQQLSKPAPTKAATAKNEHFKAL